MASLIIGTSSSSMASRFLSFSSTLSFSHSHSVTGGVSISSSQTPSLAISVTTSPPLPLVYCGRGDRKTAKGKRFSHSFGNARPRNKKKGRGPPKAPVPPSAPRKDPFDSGDIVKIEIADE